MKLLLSNPRTSIFGAFHGFGQTLQTSRRITRQLSTRSSFSHSRASDSVRTSQKSSGRPAHPNYLTTKGWKVIMAETAGVNMEDLQRTGTLAEGTAQDLQAAPTLENYRFPTHRLKKVMADSSKEPLVLVSCGSFSPITFLHLRMFEMAADFAKYNTNFEVLGGYMSPVGDAYKKIGLARAHHRIEMCTRSTEEMSNWIMVDTFEPLHKEYLPTAVVLDHMDHEINEVLGGIETADGERKKVRVALLAGADLIQTMSTPGVWAPSDLDHILGRYGAFIIERAGTETDEALQSLRKWEKNIDVIPQLVQNDVSSTKIRLFLKRDMSIRYLVPEPAIRYIEEHGLYEDDGTSSVQEKEKPDDKGKEPSSSK